jgi:glycosylphosphatidylinositol transamidase (GPIT) subunit GPI8
MKRSFLTTPGPAPVLLLTGHGGIDFYKFRETNVLWAKELADAVDYMWHAGRCAACHASDENTPASSFDSPQPLSFLPSSCHSFGRLLIIFETCHAESFLAHLKTPNVVAIATSGMDEDSVAVGLIGRVVALSAFTDIFLTRLPRSPQGLGLYGAWPRPSG